MGELVWLNVPSRGENACTKGEMHWGRSNSHTWTINVSHHICWLLLEFFTFPLLGIIEYFSPWVYWYRLWNNLFVQHILIDFYNNDLHNYIKSDKDIGPCVDLHLCVNSYNSMCQCFLKRHVAPGIYNMHSRNAYYKQYNA